MNTLALAILMMLYGKPHEHIVFHVGKCDRTKIIRVGESIPNQSHDRSLWNTGYTFRQECLKTGYWGPVYESKYDNRSLKFEPIPFEPVPPIDVPPIEEEYGNPGNELCDMGVCHWIDIDAKHNWNGFPPRRRTRNTCADKSRFLMTDESGQKHCIALVPRKDEK